jgi:short-subunit dehydrogenase
LPGRSLAVPTDISRPAEAHALVERAIAEFGQVDILVNNAGIGIVGPVESLDAAELEQVFAVNLGGAISTIQAVVPVMRQRRRGLIINVSSVVGAYALPYAGGYAASKGALDRLTEALRMELRGSGIMVTLFRPGTTRTEFSRHRAGHGYEKRRMVPAGVSPEKVAQALLRAARREPRVAYVTARDRLQLLVTGLAPGVVERLLTWAFQWERE